MANNRVVWITRHGERLDRVDRNWKRNCDFNSSDDPPLTEKGRVQSRELADSLFWESDIEHIFSSPFRRCVETAHIIAEKLGKTVNIEPGICEILYKHPPGYLDVNGLKQLFPTVNQHYIHAAEHYRMDSYTSEAYDYDVFVRVGTAVGAILSKFKEGEILFVGHGASVAGILQELSDLHSNVGLCTLSKLEGHTGNLGQWTASFIGDTKHLTDKTNLRAF